MTALLAASWSAAAAGYDAVFVRQFAPWTGTCVEHLRRRAPALPADGPVWVACCGPGQELPLLHAALRDGREEEPPRRILASDLAPGMVDLAALKAAKIGPHCTAEVGDAMQPPGKGLAAIFSVFGLQVRVGLGQPLLEGCDVRLHISTVIRQRLLLLSCQPMVPVLGAQARCYRSPSPSTNGFTVQVCSQAS